MDSPSLEVSPRLSIPRDLLHFSFTRSGGPGGQNVNKRSTAVLLRVMAADLAQLLPPEACERLRLLAGPAWVGNAQEGESLLIRADGERSQAANREAAEARLVTLLKMALVEPKRRRKTKVKYGAKMRRLANKKHQSEKKGARRGE